MQASRIARRIDAAAQRVRDSPAKEATDTWGVSSAGRATALQAVGQGFDPPTLHHFILSVLTLRTRIRIQTAARVNLPLIL